MSSKQKNVLGGTLESCCLNPLTGYFRNGLCETDEHDVGQHTVCVEMTDDFLEFSKSRGNDLSTERPEFNFPGLKAGDCWCLCVLRWKEALEANMAPAIRLQSTHENALKYVSLSDLKKYAMDLQ